LPTKSPALSRSLPLSPALSRSLPLSPALSRSPNSQKMQRPQVTVTSFVNLAFPCNHRKMMRKGQPMVFLTALYNVQNKTGNTGPVPLMDIIDYIIENLMWANHNTKFHGYGDVHSCAAHTGYKHKGRLVYSYPHNRQRKIILTRLQANVINIFNYRETSTRRTDNSVILNNWCKVTGDGRYYF
jgi:hypothetical protein